ncbi:MAG: aspartate carbamoyltransferase catalytic subunit [Planctomycetes bacterium]|jgi:aspartate carbamoyltransferase catalytic subunit|nr:aspartate carbamoyltransferase catalytic subunit [Planctomycetota bacterium]
MDDEKRDFVSIDDLGNEEILGLFRLADAYDEDLRAWASQCTGSILATLFFEPSTRTRLSFESAMQRLGGSIISANDGEVMSAAKGESLADTVRVVGGRYADIIVLRHPHEGAARVASRFADVPVINGGDGAHEHPTQTLCDLYTLWKEKGRIDGIEVLLAGDLKYSRTVHSLAYALARFGASLVCVPFPGLEIPKSVLERMQRDWGADVTRGEFSDISGLTPGKDAVYVTPHKPHQESLFTQITPPAREKIDAIYMTRLQKERLERDLDSKDYPSIDSEFLKETRFRDTRVMHPLPRVDEISYDLDQDPRAIYFRQAALGVPIRMALLAFLLGVVKLDAPLPERSSRPVYRSDAGINCANPACVTNGEGHRYLAPEFTILRDSPPLLRCVYCDLEVSPSLVGHVASKKLHRGNAAEAKRILPERRVYFEDEGQADSAGFGTGATS